MPDSSVVPSMSVASTGTVLGPTPVSAPAVAAAALPPLLAALGLMTPQKDTQLMPSLPMMQVPPSFTARALDLAPSSISDAPATHTLHLTNLDLALRAGSVQGDLPAPTSSHDSLTAELVWFADVIHQGDSLRISAVPLSMLQGSKFCLFLCQGQNLAIAIDFTF